MLLLSRSLIVFMGSLSGIKLRNFDITPGKAPTLCPARRSQLAMTRLDDGLYSTAVDALMRSVCQANTAGDLSLSKGQRHA